MLKEKGKAGRLTLPDFKTYYKVTVIKTVVLVKTDQWNRREGPEIGHINTVI